MKPLRKPVFVNRRDFLREEGLRLGMLTLGVEAAGSFATLRARGAANASRENPFAYDVERFERTNPDLIGYVETTRFKSPCDQPRRMALDIGGQIHLAGANCVCVLRTEGTVASEIGLDSPPQCVAVDRDGTIYVGFRDHIEVYGRDGKRKATWEPVAGRPFITGLATGIDDLFVADSGNRVLLRCNREGKIVGRIGAKDLSRNVPGLVLPSPHLDVELGADGLLRVNNPGRHRVESYGLDGALKGWWGKPSAAIDGFCGCCNPVSIALFPDGRVVTCEKGLPRVKVYRPTGELESVVAGPEIFRENARAGGGSASDVSGVGLDAVVDAQGGVYVLDRVTGNIHVMAPRTAAQAAPRQ